KTTVNALGIELDGCPLDEKISEMHALRKAGDPIGALALVAVDNPMCPGTGHRICNDCMKSCIYQKQEPVNIPQIETGVLTDVLEGFGGVSEYGITVRWDKNFLTLLHLTLARRRGLKMYGGVRFGGTVPIEDAWSYGFDHVAIAAGAGRPTIIDMKNNLIRGIRKASDFLMALQLTGAFKRDALPNLQARVPAVVIGGGLTAIDTATEL